jgi:hypothetical protein
MIFIGVGLLQQVGITAWNVLLAGTIAISLFCASFYLISLGVRDIAHPRRRITSQPVQPEAAAAVAVGSGGIV